jgi:hypothetical protein
MMSIARQEAQPNTHGWPSCTSIAVAAALLLGLLATGCSKSARVYVNAEADLGFYTKVGVVPFQTLSRDRFAGEKFGIEFTTALLAAKAFDVVDYGVFVNHVVQAIGSRTASDGLSVEELKKIAEVSGVQGVFYGTVMQYEMVRSSSGNFPVISVEARLLDAQTGTVVWMATLTERGGPKTPIIGVGEIHTLGELAQKVCKKLVSRLD